MKDQDKTKEELSELRRQPEDTSRASDLRYRRLFERAPLMYVVTRNEQGVPFISDCNELFLTSIGYTREEVQGKPLADFYSLESRWELLDGGGYLRALAGAFFIGERQLVTRDGRLIPTLLYTTTEVDLSGQVTGTCAMFVDITDRKKAEVALRQSEQMLRAILSASPVGIIATRDRRIRWANDTWIKMFGFTSEQEYLDQPTSIMHHSQDYYEHARKMLYDSLQPGQVSEADLTLKRKDGTSFDSHVRISLVDASDPSKGTISAIADISDRKKTEEEFRESEQRHRSLIEHLPQRIFIKDRNSVYVSCNTNYAADLGIVPEQIVGKDDFAFHPVELAQMYRADDQACMATGTVKDFEEPYQLSGQERWAHTIKVPYTDREGRVIGVLGIFEDITDHKRAEETLWATKREWEDTFNSINDMITIHDKDYNIIHYNTAAKRILGLPNLMTSDVIKCYQLYHGKDCPPETCPSCQCLQTQEQATFEFFEPHLNMFVEVRAIPRFDSNGLLTGLVHIVRDITERIMKEEALQEIEERFRLTFQTNPDAININRLSDGVYIDVNEGFTAITGYSREEVIGKSSLELDIWHNPQDRQRLVESLQEAGYVTNRESKFRFKDGTVITGLMSARVIMLKGEPHIVSITRNIEEWRRTQEALRESEQRYRTLFEESIDGVYSVLRDGEITDANASFCELFGYKKEAMIGKDIRELYFDPADRPRFQKKIEKEGFVKDYEVKFRKRDGTEVDCLLTSSVHFGKDGSIAGYRGILRDLTIRKELHGQLQQAQKMEAVGTLAGGIAHDFNNILQVVLGYSELVLADEDLPDRLREDLGRVLLAGKNGADLVQRLLTFSRKTETKPLNLDLNQRIRQTQKFLERTIPKMINIELVLADDLARIYADPTQVDQVLMNLAVNARDAMPEGGRLVIETANVFLDEECDRALFGVKPGECVLLSVSDTGHGMDKETLDHIFEPFYTTKEAGKGTGLGLAIVYGIVHQQGGYITCYSEPGEGTTFKMYFPVIEMEMNPDVATTGIMPAFGTETILLVDDEEFVRDLGKRILERSGYTVLTAANGKEALELYRRGKETISLVILDLIMPEMGGKQCLEELLKIDPKARVLIASGFTANGQKKEASETGVRGFVGKPYNIKGMLQAVREVLDSD